MSSYLVVLGWSKPNIVLKTAFGLIIYTGLIITQIKKGYWNNIRELNFPTENPKVHNE